MNRSSPPIRLFASLFIFIFAGAIVGETAALSIVVSVAGSQILSKLYLVNGLLLFLLPAFFFKNIDKVNRAKLLSTLLFITTVFILIFLGTVQISGMSDTEIPHLLLWAIYPVSYLSKTVMFLTFWTLANDIYKTGEAKREFPKIAAWGFLGGLSGALIGGFILDIIQTEAVILLWAACYLVAFLISRYTHTRYSTKLLKKERIRHQSNRRGILREVEDVLSINLVKLISALYFLVFLAIFALDFLFWHKCHVWFPLPESLASFQFNFYLTHGIITILGLWFVMPGLISKVGFTKIFFILPVVLFSGTIILLGIQQVAVNRLQVIFAGFVALQFARHVVFENAFSPVYQMFFAAISREKRGRAKTFLEGIIKPSAIILTALFLMVASQHTWIILMIIAIDAACMIVVVAKIRKTYMQGLVPAFSGNSNISDIIAKIGSQYDQKMLSILREYSQSPDADLRGLAVKILSSLGTRQALRIMVDIYHEEKELSVKESVARCLKNFYWYETKGFIKLLLDSSEPRIRANAIYSLNNMNCHWKWQLRNRIKELLFEPSMRVQIEAAQYLWLTQDDRERYTVIGYLESLLSSRNTNKRSAGIYLLGTLQPDRWEQKILHHLRSTSPQIYKKSVEVILRSSSSATQLKMFGLVETLSRHHIAICGKVAQTVGIPLIHTLVAYIKLAENRRMLFEIVTVLKKILEEKQGARKLFNLDDAAKQRLEYWIIDELKGVYLDGYMWYLLNRKKNRNAHWDILDDALHEQIFRVCEWAVNTLVLIEKDDVVSRMQKDINLNDTSQRHDLAEIVGRYPNSRLKTLIYHILEFRSWALIGKNAKQYFHFKEPENADLHYFVRSRNKWISLCALYCVCMEKNSDALLNSQKDYLISLRTDPYVYLARAAEEIIENSLEETNKKMETLRLLDTVLFFKKTILFRNVQAEKLMGLAEISELVNYPRETIVSKEGEISDHLYIVRSGSLKIFKAKNGVRTILSIIRVGEAYGEIGLFNESPRSATAIANENCEVYVIKRSSLKTLLMDIPEIAYNFLEIFSNKLRQSGEEVALLHTTLTGKLKQDMVVGS